MFHPQIILAPTDFSESSKYAFSVAVDLARQNGARLLALYVADTLGPENATYGEISTHLQPEFHQGELMRELRLNTTAAAGVDVEHILAEGDPATEIERVASERHCELIVMATHGHSGLMRLLTGSVAEHVIRLVSCPVLICKVPAAAASQSLARPEPA